MYISHRIISNLLADESGQDIIEYALMAALITLAAVSAIQTVGKKISNTFNSVGSDI